MHAGTVASGYLEAEWGATADKNGSAQSLYFKLGLTRRSQLGLSVPLDLSGSDVGALGFHLKLRIADDAPLLGKFAIQPYVLLPDGGTGARAGAVAISSHKFGGVALDAIVDVRTDDVVVWAGSFGIPVGPRFGWVAEAFGGSESAVSFLTGPTYLLRNWFSVDAGVIIPTDNGQAVRFYAGGVTNFGRIVRR